MIVAVRQANAVRYFKLDPSQSLVLQLAQKAVIEFPVLLVLLPDEVQISILRGMEIRRVRSSTQTPCRGSHWAGIIQMAVKLPMCFSLMP